MKVKYCKFVRNLRLLGKWRILKYKDRIKEGFEIEKVCEYCKNKMSLNLYNFHIFMKYCHPRFNIVGYMSANDKDKYLSDLEKGWEIE